MPPLQACYDFRVRSAIPLPELPASQVDRGDVVDIAAGHVAESLNDEAPRPYALQCDGPRALLAVPGVGRFLVEGASRVTVCADANAEASAVRLFLLGSVMGIVAHLRGLLLLHGNAIEVAGRAVSFVGPSRAGKSTLAARFANAGYRVLCDDVCAIRMGEDGLPVVWPGPRSLRLWGDAAGALGHDVAAGKRIRRGIDKYTFALSDASFAPLPLARVCALERSDLASSRDCERLSGADAMAVLLSNTYRRNYLTTLGLDQARFKDLGRLAGAICVDRMPRPWGLDMFETTFAAIEASVRENTPGARLLA